MFSGGESRLLSQGIDNTAIPPSYRFYKQRGGLIIGLSYASGGNPGFYDSEANAVMESDVDFDNDPDITLFTDDGLRLLRDTMDSVNRLWDTEYDDFAFNLGYEIGDFLVYSKLNYQVRSYNLRYTAVQYNQAFFDRLVVQRREEIIVPVDSDSRFGSLVLGTRYTAIDNESFKVYIRPEGRIDLISDDAQFFNNTPNMLSIPIGFVTEFNSFGILLESGFNLREGNMSEQFTTDFSFFLKNVTNTVLFLDVQYVQSLDDPLNDGDFIQFQHPSAPSYLTVAPGFSIFFNDAFDLNFRYRVDLWNTNNYGMKRFSIGANYMLR
jgi:hypothetical protein